MEIPKSTVQRPPPRSTLRKTPGEFLPARVQKSYFMLSAPERGILNTALELWWPHRNKPVLIGGLNQLKTALRLMGTYRLVIEQVEEARAITSYTRWLEAVLVNESDDQVYVTLSPRFDRLWLEVRKRLVEHMASHTAKMKLRGRYALRLYDWAQKYAGSRAKRISVEQLRKVLGVEGVKDPEGNTVQEPPLQIWANLRQRALDSAITEINKKTDLTIVLESLGRSKHRRVTTLSFAIKAKARDNSEG